MEKSLDSLCGRIGKQTGHFIISQQFAKRRLKNTIEQIEKLHIAHNIIKCCD